MLHQERKQKPPCCCTNHFSLAQHAPAAGRLASEVITLLHQIMIEQHRLRLLQAEILQPLLEQSHSLEESDEGTRVYFQPA